MNMHAGLAALHRLEELTKALRKWEPLICDALRRGQLTHTFEDIMVMIIQHRVFFYGFPACFLIMEVVKYPQFSNFHCFLAGGDMKAVMEAEKPMMAIARELGCKNLTIAGRSGWTRKLKHKGWEHVASTMYKPVTEQEELPL